MNSEGLGRAEIISGGERIIVCSHKFYVQEHDTAKII